MFLWSCCLLWKMDIWCMDSTWLELPRKSLGIWVNVWTWTKEHLPMPSNANVLCLENPSTKIAIRPAKQCRTWHSMFEILEGCLSIHALVVFIAQSRGTKRFTGTNKSKVCWSNMESRARMPSDLIQGTWVHSCFAGSPWAKFAKYNWKTKVMHVCVFEGIYRSRSRYLCKCTCLNMSCDCMSSATCCAYSLASVPHHRTRTPKKSIECPCARRPRHSVRLKD